MWYLELYGCRNWGLIILQTGMGTLTYWVSNVNLNLKSRKFNTENIFRFTSILGNRKFSETIDTPAPVERKSCRLSNPEAESSVGLYPDECQLCGKVCIQEKGKRVSQRKILTKTTESAIKNAAKSKDQVHFRDSKCWPSCQGIQSTRLML